MSAKTMERPAVKPVAQPPKEAEKEKYPGTLERDGVFFSDAEIQSLFPGQQWRARRAVRTAVRDEIRSHVPINAKPKKPPSVRVATIRDEQRIFDLLMQDLAEGKAEHLGRISEEAVIEYIHGATRAKRNTCGVIDGPDGQPIALIMLIYERAWWTKEWHLTETTTYVHPDYRFGRHAINLLEWAKWMSYCCTEQFGYSVPLLSGVLSLFNIKSKIRLYSRHMNQIGAFFFWPFPKGLSQ